MCEFEGLIKDASQDEENAEHAAFEAAQHAAERRAYLEEMQSPADDSKQPAAAGDVTCDLAS
eukprot:898471-Amphidinium_carterae.1